VIVILLSVLCYFRDSTLDTFNLFYCLVDLVLLHYDCIILLDFLSFLIFAVSVAWVVISSSTTTLRSTFSQSMGPMGRKHLPAVTFPTKEHLLSFQSYAEVVVVVVVVVDVLCLFCAFSFFLFLTCASTRTSRRL
jgi:hypothetical protein